MWNKVTQDTWRMKVEGGWIVRYDAGIGEARSSSMVFVPDPNYNWVLL